MPLTSFSSVRNPKPWTVSIMFCPLPDIQYAKIYCCSQLMKVHSYLYDFFKQNVRIVQNERGALAEGIIDDIMAQQKIDVDAVTSATNSSNVIKKAIENALINAS